MPNEDGVSLQNSGTINMHGSVIGGRGNQVGAGAASAASGVGVEQLFGLLTSIRISAASAADLPPDVQAHVIGGAAQAQRHLAAGNAADAASMLLRTRLALEPAATTATGATLREMMETALDLAGGL